VSNIRMLMTNRWDDAELSVSAGTPIPTLPIVNSQVYGRSKTSGITPDDEGVSVMTFNLAQLTLLNGLVLYRHWLSNGAKWQLELFEGLACTGAKLFDSGLLDAVQTKTLGELNWLVDPLVSSAFDQWPFKFSQLWFNETFALSGRITLIDPDARDGIHEFDRVYLGVAFEPSVNFSYQSEFAWQTTTQQKLTAAGSVFAVDKPKSRQLAFSLDYVPDLERPHLSAAIQHVGLSLDWFISLYPLDGGTKEIEHAMAAKFTAIPPLSNTFFNNYTAKFVVREA
jgi:hypothetical protein